jgi:hypothetical protein
MLRANGMTLLGVTAAALIAVGASAAQDKPASAKPDDKHAAMFAECAKACDDCKRSCDMCAAHCAKLIAETHPWDAVTFEKPSDAPIAYVQPPPVAVGSAF